MATFQGTTVTRRANVLRGLAVGLACTLACGCEVGSSVSNARFDLVGRVNLRAALRSADGTFQGHRVVRDADGVRVELLLGTRPVALTTDGEYRFPSDQPYLYTVAVRTAVAGALVDTARQTAQYELAGDTLQLFSDEAAQVRPNPFVATTDVRFVVGSAGHVVVDVLSLSGAKLRTLASLTLPAGVHNVSWDGTDGAGRQVAVGPYWIVTTQGGVQNAELALRSPATP